MADVSSVVHHQTSQGGLSRGRRLNDAMAVKRRGTWNRERGNCTSRVACKVDIKVSTKGCDMKERDSEQQNGQSDGLLSYDAMTRLAFFSSFFS